MRYVVDEKGCWNFTGSLDKDGYGKIKIKDKTFRPHRVMAQICIKAYLAETEVVGHRCDNPQCINPAHLFITTNAGNTADREAKRRGAFGERLSQSKLTSENVIQIRKLHSDGRTLKEISAMFDVTPGCIHAIMKGRTWRHVA